VALATDQRVVALQFLSAAAAAAVMAAEWQKDAGRVRRTD